MKTTMIHGLVLLTMLGLGIGCKKEVEEQPVPNLQNCRIVKETYSTIYISGNKVNEQEVIAEGQKFTVCEWTVKRYTYDAQGRLSKERQNGNRGYDVNYYELDYVHTPERVTIKQFFHNDGKEDQRSEDIIELNEQGFNANYFYDSEGQRLAMTGQPTQSGSEWVNGNLVKYWYRLGAEQGTSVLVYQYDLTKPALPTPYAYRGKPSKNLQIQYQIQAQNSLIYRNGPVYQINSYYEFDKYGRVRRCIMRDHQFPGSGWPYGSNPGGIGVTDYEYECP